MHPFIDALGRGQACARRGAARRAQKPHTQDEKQTGFSHWGTLLGYSVAEIWGGGKMGEKVDLSPVRLGALI
jgi:hypothetical protein